MAFISPDHRFDGLDLAVSTFVETQKLQDRGTKIPPEIIKRDLGVLASAFLAAGVDPHSGTMKREVLGGERTFADITQFDIKTLVDSDYKVTKDGLATLKELVDTAKGVHASSAKRAMHEAAGRVKGAAILAGAAVALPIVAGAAAAVALGEKAAEQLGEVAEYVNEQGAKIQEKMIDAKNVTVSNVKRAAESLKKDLDALWAKLCDWYDKSPVKPYFDKIFGPVGRVLAQAYRACDNWAAQTAAPALRAAATKMAKVFEPVVEFGRAAGFYTGVGLWVAGEKAKAAGRAVKQGALAAGRTLRDQAYIAAVVADLAILDAYNATAAGLKSLRDAIRDPKATWQSLQRAGNDLKAYFKGLPAKTKQAFSKGYNDAISGLFGAISALQKGTNRLSADWKKNVQPQLDKAAAFVARLAEDASAKAAAFAAGAKKALAETQKGLSSAVKWAEEHIVGVVLSDDEKARLATFLKDLQGRIGKAESEYHARFAGDSLHDDTIKGLTKKGILGFGQGVKTRLAALEATLAPGKRSLRKETLVEELRILERRALVLLRGGEALRQGASTFAGRRALKDIIGKAA